jgi:DHA1 family tetracycline resistance protein-like MFS transporter
LEVEHGGTGETRAGTRLSLALIFFIMLLDIVGLTILGPVAPYIVRQYSSEALMVTLITVIYAAAQFLAAPLLGKLGDRYGRRPILLISVFGSVVGYVMFGLGGSLWILFLSRLIDGITGGNLSTASAYIADVSKPEERAQNLTLVGMAWGLGLILGPALGGVFSQISLEAPAFCAAGLSSLGVLIGFFLLPESLPKERREVAPIRLKDLNPFVAIGQMARKPGLSWLLVVLCLFNFTFNSINTTESVFMIWKYAALPWQVGLQLVLLGIAIAVVQAAFVPKLVPRYGEKRVAMLSILGQAVGGLAAFFSPFLWLFYVITVLSRAVSGFVFPTLTTLLTNRVSEREIGVLMGVTTALGSLMNIFGPAWGGAVYDKVMPGAPYWMGAIVFVAAALMLVRTNAALVPAHHAPAQLAFQEGDTNALE